MADIDKMIAELKELMAKATLGKWSEWGLRHLLNFGYRTDGTWTEAIRQNEHMPIESDAPIIVAMHNYLPELLVELENRNCTACHDAAEQAAVEWKARAEDAEAERDVATEVVENIQSKVAMYSGDMFHFMEKYEACSEALQRAEAERDALAGKLGSSSICWRYSGKHYCPDPVLRRECKKCWIFRAGQEVAAQEAVERECAN